MVQTLILWGFFVNLDNKTAVVKINHKLLYQITNLQNFVRKNN